MVTGMAPRQLMAHSSAFTEVTAVSVSQSLSLPTASPLAGNGHSPGGEASDTPIFYLQETKPAPCILKVHYKYTVAMQVQPGLSYKELLNLICKKLELQPEHTQLR